MAHQIKQTIPFDTLSFAEDDPCKQLRRDEKFTVKVNGFKCDTIRRKVTAHETHINYSGGEYQIQGCGYDRYISISG